MKAINFLLTILLFLFFSCNNNQANLEAKEELLKANLELFIDLRAMSRLGNLANCK